MSSNIYRWIFFKTLFKLTFVKLDRRLRPHNFLQAKATTCFSQVSGLVVLGLVVLVVLGKY